MKNFQIVLVSVMALIGQSIYSQKMPHEDISTQQDKPIYLEAGINLSLPVHIEMYRTHRLAIGINTRAAKKVSEKWELGVRIEYDYRFTRRNLPEIDPDITDEVQRRALHRNFGLISIKPNAQYNFKSQWYWGAESGIGYAISDENGKIGLGFVSEYNGRAQLGSCSGLYLGKYFSIDNKEKKLGVSLNLTNFVVKGHAENVLGLKFNYRFRK